MLKDSDQNKGQDHLLRSESGSEPLIRSSDYDQDLDFRSQSRSGSEKSQNQNLKTR